MKNLKIQLKKQNNSIVIDSKSVISFEYHDFLNVFFKEKSNVLSFHKKHVHRIELLLEKKEDHEYAFLYNLSKEKLQLIKKNLKKHLNKNFIESSTTLYASLILFVKKSDDDLHFCVDYCRLQKSVRFSIFGLALFFEPRFDFVNH
jgi:hypothetical protein